MKFHLNSALIHVPDGHAEPEALARTTHLGIGAHQDDLEFMALHGILQCVNQDDRWFTGVTCTNGAGSARTGPYAAYTDEAMQAERKAEQNRAADIGHYAAMIQLDYPSAAVKAPDDNRLADDIHAILQIAKPDFIYTHNPADKHDTHIGVTVAVLDAVRRLPMDQRPKHVWGCEVWRDLDWLSDEDKVVLDVSGHDDLARRLNACFASQIAGGKRYDLAVEGRRRANATFFDSHQTDAIEQAWFAMDLTPLAHDTTLDIADYTLNYIDCFRADVEQKLKKRMGR